MTCQQRTRIVMLVPHGEETPRLAAFLQRTDFEVLEVETGVRALEVITGERCDLLIAVLPVPDTSVGRLVSELRLLERSGASTPLLLIGRTPQLEAARAFESESVRVFDRGESVESLHQAVASSLGVASRLAIRLPVELEVEVESGTSLHFCETRNLSASGMLISSSSALPVGSVFDFELILPRLFEPLQGRAQVVRLSDPQCENTTGFGARFVELTNAESSQLDRYVRAELRGR